MIIEIELEECNTCSGSGHKEYIDDDYREHWIEHGCKECGGVGKITYTSINNKKCKLNLEVI
tara:strand:- start:330 stop:515 length:186 start_codon:yes stop_codon:yes gene_type:complete